MVDTSSDMKIVREENKEFKIRDFDEVLDYIGGWGPFQYMITLIFFPVNIFLGYVLLSPILTLFAPPHWCKVPDLANLPREERKLLAIPQDTEVAGGFSQCSQYVVEWSQVGFDIFDVVICGYASRFLRKM